MNAMPTILIVEPNALFREALVKTIQSQFPELAVIQSTTAEEALEKSIVEKPQLVLMDIQLEDGGGQGLALIRDIAAQQPETRIAVLTDSDDREYRKAALDKGADHFISKTESNEGQKVLAVIKEALLQA